MKQIIRRTVADAVKKAFEKGLLPSDQMPDMDVEEPRHKAHGDLSSNVAMVSAALQKMPPRKIAEILVSHIETGDLIRKVEIAGPGFINFFLSNFSFAICISPSNIINYFKLNTYKFLETSVLTKFSPLTSRKNLLTIQVAPYGLAWSSR